MAGYDMEDVDVFVLSCDGTVLTEYRHPTSKGSSLIPIKKIEIEHKVVQVAQRNEKTGEMLQYCRKVTGSSPSVSSHFPAQDLGQDEKPQNFLLHGTDQQ